ncbi:alpha/beta hydrolase [Caryophanon tenue]|uniref:Carboxylesterase n=1 Tax=Caryophanon tenue TaxID=33978 RepID=A0A1C0YBI3_9BACL|nr:alpha/beta fold hydrolase [Caryophanon tenue]OCS84493.1 carboxylesterase [Caryophanon tenue]
MTTGVLCLHGFSGAPYEVQPFADYITAHTGWLVAVPTLPGHGETLSMKGYTAKHWVKAAELAYLQLAKQVDDVIVVGFSMGGLLAMHLVKIFKVKKLVLLSAALQYVSPAQLLKDLRDMLILLRQRKLRNDELFLRYQQKIRHVPLRATLEFTKVVAAVKPFYQTIHVPTFIVQGAQDGIVPVATATLLYETISATEKELYISQNGKHHICYSDDCRQWFSTVLTFLQKSPLSEH